MMKYIIHSKQIIILCPPKCGSTSITTYITLDNNIIRHVKNHEEWIKYKDLYKIFLIIRNPYDRIVSAYINKFVEQNTLKKIDILNFKYNNNEIYKTLPFSSYYIENNDIFHKLWKDKGKKFIFPSFNEFIEIIYDFYSQGKYIDQHYNSISNILNRNNIDIKSINIIKLDKLNLFFKNIIGIDLKNLNNTKIRKNIDIYDISTFSANKISIIPEYKYFITIHNIEQIKNLYKDDIFFYFNNY